MCFDRGLSKVWLKALQQRRNCIAICSHKLPPCLSAATSVFLTCFGRFERSIIQARFGYFCSKNAKLDAKQFSVVSVSSLFFKGLQVWPEGFDSPWGYFQLTIYN